MAAKKPAAKAPAKKKASPKPPDGYVPLIPEDVPPNDWHPHRSVIKVQAKQIDEPTAVLQPGGGWALAEAGDFLVHYDGGGVGVYDSTKFFLNYEVVSPSKA